MVLALPKNSRLQVVPAAYVREGGGYSPIDFDSLYPALAISPNEFAVERLTWRNNAVSGLDAGEHVVARRVTRTANGSVYFVREVMVVSKHRGNFHSHRVESAVRDPDTGLITWNTVWDAATWAQASLHNDGEHQPRLSDEGGIEPFTTHGKDIDLGELLTKGWKYDLQALVDRDD